MNQYTRREEIRWLLISAVVMCLAVAAAMGLLVTAQGTLVPDVEAQRAADAAQAKTLPLEACPATITKLNDELGVFRKIAAAAELQPTASVVAPPKPDPRGPYFKGPPLPPEKKPKHDDNTALAWPGAKGTYALAVALAPCEAPSVEAAAPDANAQSGWTAVEAVASLAPPAEGDKQAEVIAAKKVFDLLDKAPLDAVAANVQKARQVLDERAKDLASKATTAQIRKPLPKGLLGRGAAIGAGLGISIIALLFHFFSLRAASVRRAVTLLGLRPQAQTEKRGMQAAAILKLATEQNAGEPGLVIGCALGGVLAAGFLRQDADWFVVGVMAGLVLGVLIQFALVNSAPNEDLFRKRALELAEIEKPTVPIVLALSTIPEGQETQFLDAFLKLNPEEAGTAVEKMATQAEEQILVAADAQAIAENPQLDPNAIPGPLG